MGRGEIEMKPAVATILAASVAGCLTSGDNYAAGNMSQSEVARIPAMIMEQVQRCWSPPVGMAGLPKVVVSFELNQDGTLARDPVAHPVNSGDAQSATYQAAAKSAVRAVRACTPLRLPEARYDVWKDVEIVFDPREMRTHPGDAKR
jgi:colicin import membrane protein